MVKLTSGHRYNLNFILFSLFTITSITSSSGFVSESLIIPRVVVSWALIILIFIGFLLRLSFVPFLASLLYLGLVICLLQVQFEWVKTSHSISISDFELATPNISLTGLVFLIISLILNARPWRQQLNTYLS